MATETIALVLSLFAIITSAVTAPVGQSLKLVTVQNTTAGAVKDSISIIPDRLKSFQLSCRDAGEPSKDCFAYNKMVNDMLQHNIRSNDSDQLFRQELSRTVTPQEDLCSNLTELVKKIPKPLMHDELKPFAMVKNCVNVCYAKTADDEEVLKDSCRLLYVGYKALLQAAVQQSPSQPDTPEQKPVIVQASNQHDILPNEQMKPLNVTTNSNKEPASKIVPKVSNNQQTEVKIPKVDNAPSKTQEEIVVKETNKQEQITVPKVDNNVPQPVPVKNVDNGEIEQEGNNDLINNSEDAENAENIKDQYDSNESAGKSSENINEVANTEDERRVGNPISKESILAKPGNLREDELPEPVENSRTSDIMQGSDPFYNQNDSNFFSYFLFAMFSCAMLYVAYHNKSKLMALVVEGRRTSNGRGGFSKGRKHTAAYRKLDSNLEEAITSGSASGGQSSSQIIY